MFVSFSEEPKYYTKDESDNKYALKSDVVNVYLSKYATIDQVNEVLTENCRTKDDVSYKTIKSIPFERTADNCYETCPFVNGAHIVGTFTRSDKAYNLDCSFYKLYIG